MSAHFEVPAVQAPHIQMGLPRPFPEQGEGGQFDYGSAEFLSRLRLHA